MGSRVPYLYAFRASDKYVYNIRKHTSETHNTVSLDRHWHVYPSVLLHDNGINEN